MKAWLQTHHAKLQFGLRMTLAALASYVLGEAIGLSQTYWAVLSSVIVIQGSVGGSVRAGLNRLVGTIGGAFWGALVAGGIPHAAPASLALALVVAIAPLAIVTGFWTDYRVAPVTAIIVLMGTVLQQAAPFSSALERVLEISLGSAVAVAVAVFIFPARAHALVARSASNAVSDMAAIVSMLEDARGHGVDPQALLKVQLRLSAEVAKTDMRAGEAKVERTNRLADAPDPEPLARTLRRLRNDLAMLCRALVTPLSEAIRGRIAPQLTAVLHALVAWFSDMAEALPSGRHAPALEDLKAAIEVFHVALAGAGQDWGVSPAEKEDVQRVLALPFVFDQMLQDLQDLVDRAGELRQSHFEA